MKAGLELVEGWLRAGCELVKGWLKAGCRLKAGGNLVEGWFRADLCVGDQAMPGAAGTILQNYLHGTRIFCFYHSSANR